LLAIWPGDAGWGPRYLVPIVPFIVLPAGAALVWTRGIVRRVCWGAFGVLFELGVIINLGGVLVDQRVSFVRLLDEAGGNFDVTRTIRDLQDEMIEASNNLEFEKAALLRDQIRELKRTFDGGGAPAEKTSPRPVSYKQGKRGKKQRV